MSNEEQKPALQQTDVIRRAFDVEKHNGKLFIYTFYWNDEGERVWCANSIRETELRRIVEGMQKFL
jgi:hypothetical protein